MMSIEEMNKEYCETETITSFASWYEGEEGWGVDDDDDDDDNNSSNDNGDDK